jgi:uncharacterized protein YndB with AHSA1/START domain
VSKTSFEVDKENLEVRITRVFNATPERLWQAYTDPEQIQQWWIDTVVDKHDFKVGGTWRFVSGPDGKNSFRGEFKEIDEPRKIVRTFEYEPMPGHVLVESVTLEPQADGQTKVLTVSRYDNLDDLNGMVGMGMEEGSSAGLDRLAALVEPAQ